MPNPPLKSGPKGKNASQPELDHQCPPEIRHPDDSSDAGVIGGDEVTDKWGLDLSKDYKSDAGNQDAGVIGGDEVTKDWGINLSNDDKSDAGKEDAGKQDAGGQDAGVAEGNDAGGDAGSSDGGGGTKWNGNTSTTEKED